MFTTISKPLLMGILNVTPDSFSDGGDYMEISHALAQTQRMLNEGVDILDIGGESTRPGSESISAEEQIARVIPVIQAIRRTLSTDIPISIDTTLTAVAEAAFDAGANLLNDISAGTDDPSILTLVAERELPLILMHKQGIPKTMQDQPHYEDVVAEVLKYLQQRIAACLKAGIASNSIAIDPGIGFGKRKQDNLQLLAHLEQFCASGYPVLLGTSRKRFMGMICEISDPSELVTATAITTALGVMAGVKMFRVHDIKENRQALDVAWAIKQAAETVE